MPGGCAVRIMRGHRGGGSLILKMGERTRRARRRVRVAGRWVGWWARGADDGLLGLRGGGRRGGVRGGGHGRCGRSLVLVAAAEAEAEAVADGAAGHGDGGRRGKWRLCSQLSIEWSVAGAERGGWVLRALRGSRCGERVVAYGYCWVSGRKERKTRGKGGGDGVVKEECEEAGRGSGEAVQEDVWMSVGNEVSEGTCVL